MVESENFGAIVLSRSISRDGKTSRFVISKVDIVNHFSMIFFTYSSSSAIKILKKMGFIW